MKEEIEKIIEKLESKRAFDNTPFFVIKRANDYITVIFHGTEMEFYYKFRNELVVV